MRNLKLTLFVVVLVVGWLGVFTSAQAQIITGVVRGGSSTKPPPIIAPNLLAENELCFVDRAHQYNSIPIALLGAEYVMVSNDDKTQWDYSLDVTLSQSARVFLFLDNRLGHGNTAGGDPNMNPDLWTAGMDWVYSKGFGDTGLNIGIDEQGDGDVDQWASVYVKKFQAGTVTLLQQNDTTNPSGRNMYGVAALKSKLFKAFWFYNGKLNLAQTPTPGWVTVRSGFYGGWDWFYDGGVWRQPFEDPPHGGSNLWAFTDHLTFQYADAKVRPVHRWSFVWDPSGQGNCLELMFEDEGLSSPLDPNIMNYLVIQNHDYIVNATVQGVFSNLELIPINGLEEYVRELGMTEEDVRIFLEGDIFSHLKITDPCSQGDVGIQYASWNLSEPSILLSTNSLEIIEKDAISYGVRLREQPGGQVTVNVKLGDSTAIKWADYDEDVYQLQFDQRNWDKEQVVSIVAHGPWTSSSDQTVAGLAGGYFFDTWNPAPASIAGRYFFDTWASHGRIAHYLAGDPTETAVLPVTIMDKKTGGRRYAATDINRDTKTNLMDVAFVANNYLLSTEQPQEIDPFTNAEQFTSVDIGSTGGSAEYDPVKKEWTVMGEGADIWGSADQFHYAYQPVPISTGDFQMTATVLGLEDTHEWAKAGLMLRSSLDPDSAHASILVTPERGVAFQWRPEAGAETQSVHGGPTAHLKAPVSLRLVKTGDTITGYYYAGGTWELISSLPLPLPSPVFVGMAVTSHVEGTMTTATFGSDLVSVLPVPTP
ncbi:MAG: hypothetical protein FVQ85_06170 [Planctomycetes bacterium]|nr:hypothetical protein [Planctomycetota bacterium]